MIRKTSNVVMNQIFNQIQKNKYNKRNDDDVDVFVFYNVHCLGMG